MISKKTKKEEEEEEARARERNLLANAIMRRVHGEQYPISLVLFLDDLNENEILLFFDRSGDNERDIAIEHERSKMLNY